MVTPVTFLLEMTTHGKAWLLLVEGGKQWYKHGTKGNCLVEMGSVWQKWELLGNMFLVN